MYAHCACNNRAETVMEQFLMGVETYGLPSRVRSDHCLENVKSCQRYEPWKYDNGKLCTQ